MYDELIKFIEICLIDGVISEKEKEVILLKGEKMNISIEECEILINSLLYKKSKDDNKEQTTKITGKLELTNTVKIEIDQVKILNLDIHLIEQYKGLLEKLNDRLNWIDNNKEKDSEEFRNWLYNLDGKFKIKTCKKYNKDYLYIDTVKDVGQFRPGSIHDFQVESSLIIENEVSFGVIKNSIYTDFNCDYLLTNRHLYPVYYSEGGLFSKKGWKVDFNNKISYNELELTNDKTKSILRHFIVVYFNTENIYNIIDIIQQFDFKYTFEDISGYIKSLDDSNVSLIVKVNSEILRVQNRINQFVKKLIEKEYENELDSELRVLGRFKRGYNNYGIVSVVFSNCQILINQIKLITTILTLRNQLIYFSMTKNLIKVSEIKEKLDGLGILMNYFESNSLNELKNINESINTNLVQLQQTLEDLNFEINSGVNGINEGLKNIGSSVTVSNILNGIQTYQLYKINQNTKK